MTREHLKQCRRIVIKVGTSSITHPNGKVDLRKIDRLAQELANIHNMGYEIALVSSGAVAAGVGKVACPPPTNLPDKQALAAVGQGILMHLYAKYFSEFSKSVAQILLTRDCFSEPSRYLNSRNTLFSLFKFGVIPIINENDTVAVDELKFGDNDTLSAMVACNADADLLILLSDIDGLYDSDPRKNPTATLFSEVTEITEEMLQNSTSKGSSMSSGGMTTKLLAAKICMASGIPMVIANSKNISVIREIVEGENAGTLFTPHKEELATRHVNRREWIGFGSNARGSVFIDEGASDALLKKGCNLLSSGVFKVEGDFQSGDVVSIKNHLGLEIAKGISNYGSDDAIRIMGKHSSEIPHILGATDYEELINRYNMAVLSQ